MMRSSDSSICEERVIDGVIIPYHDKLLADCGEKSSNPSEEETDINRLNPSTSESKFNRISLWIHGCSGKESSSLAYCQSCFDEKVTKEMKQKGDFQKEASRTKIQEAVWSADTASQERTWMFEHNTSSLAYPHSNGKAENAVQPVKNLLTKCKASKASEFQALLDWHNTPTVGIGTSPAQRLMDHCCKTLLQVAGPQLQPNFPTEEDTRKLIVVKERLKRNLDIDSTTTNSAIEESLSTSAVEDIEFESATTTKAYTEGINQLKLELEQQQRQITALCKEKDNALIEIKHLKQQHAKLNCSLELLHTDGPQGGFVATWAGITEDHYQPVFTIISEQNTTHKIPEVLLLLRTESSIVHIIKTMT
ncbi:hypothetical protein AWC38_SpisGene7017 [Stylophora pistillata]|uniref:Uncharacterized protein n=1 Tax=Stylophora pistillata TaxID=50429 RepID=A0A2B4SIE1_STYPI|nr:hypothetical protein AWC38_SpisGene7017 [Stylophora pistillata]